MKKILEKSYAKVNLYLNIVDLYENSYHSIDSLMVYLNLYDKITIKTNSQFKFTIKGKYRNELSNEDNIILNSINKLCERYSFKPLCEVILEKNIPISAGLGGGSSNAATVIKIFNDFFNLEMTMQQMIEIGITIGSDVPFFLMDTAQYVSGIGEILKPAEKFAPIPCVLIYPNIKISTKEVYEKYDELGANDYKNNLQPAAISIAPEIQRVIDDIAGCDGCIESRMSGSGSSCFGLFENNEQTKNAVNKLNNYDFIIASELTFNKIVA